MKRLGSLEQEGSTAQVLILILGTWLIFTGLLALIAAPTTWDTNGTVVGGIRVNGWHALFHLISGSLAVVASNWRVHTRNFSLLCGIFYAATVIFHHLYGSPALGLIATDSFGSTVHTVEAALMLGLGATSYRYR